MSKLSKIRDGNFTSSEIVALTKNGKKAGEFGAPFYTYIKQCNQERKLGKSLDSELSARPTVWGSFVEKWLMFERPDIIGIEYTLSPQSTIQHPQYDYWVGSRDGLNNSTGAIIDIKCPFTLGSFCNFADCKTIEEVRENHKDGDKYYWQLVSNAHIAGTNKAELIIFVPNYEQVKEIQEFAVMGDHENLNQLYFIGNAIDGDLPYISEDSFYKNLIKFEFEIPQEDLDFLENRVIEAGKLLWQK